MSNELIDSTRGSRPASEKSPADASSTSLPEDHASFADLKRKVSEDISSASDAIKAGAETATTKVKAVVSEQATFAAKQVEGLATALQKVGCELESSDQKEVGKYATQIGQSVEQIARQMEGKNIGEIANMAEDFGRKQPLAFLGIAALAGLTASRFLTASAKRTTVRSQSSSETAFDSNVTGGNKNG